MPENEYQQIVNDRQRLADMVYDVFFNPMTFRHSSNLLKLAYQLYPENTNSFKFFKPQKNPIIIGKSGGDSSSNGHLPDSDFYLYLANNTLNNKKYLIIERTVNNDGSHYIHSKLNIRIDSNGKMKTNFKM